MKLNIYKSEDMKGETPFMSFPNLKKGSIIKVSGLASNTTYWMQLVDDNEEIIEFKGEEKFSTSYADKNYSTYRIETEIKDDNVIFTIYSGDEIDKDLKDLDYVIYGEDKKPIEIEKPSFENGSLTLSYKEIKNPFYITVSKDGQDIADSELVKIEE